MTQNYGNEPQPERPAGATYPLLGDAQFDAPAAYSAPRGNDGWSTEQYTDAGAPQASTENTGDSGSAGTVDTAKEQAGAVADNAKQAGAEVAGTAKEQATNVAVEAKNQAQDLLHQTRSEVSEQAATQQQRVAGGVRSLGDELRSMADRSEQQGVASQLAGQAADQSHRIASFLDERDPSAVLDEIRSFARRRPGAFLLLAAGAGLVAGRLTRGVVADAHSDDDDANGPSAGSGLTGDQSRGVSADGITTPGTWSSETQTDVGYSSTGTNR